MLVVDQSLYVRQQAFAVLSEGDAGSTSCQKGKTPVSFSKAAMAWLMPAWV